MASKSNKLWGGRFGSRNLDSVDEFNASIHFDWQLYPYDIQGSIAHARMLGKQKIISAGDAKKIIGGLEKIQKEIEAGKFKFSPKQEDIHLNIESKLIGLIGKAGAKLHTGRSRNDQVATDMRLYVRDQIKEIISRIRDFQKNIIGQAKKHVDVLVPGYTHLQRAQPISLGHYFLAYFEMTERDVQRLKDTSDRLNTLPLGAGALAGTTFNIDQKFVAKSLHFSGVAHNSLDAVSDRDFVIELLSNLSILMMHLSRLAEEWILWSSQEFQFIQLPEEFCTGSSMMPQKMNPDVLELIRGKTGRVYSSLMNLLVTMKGLPLAYNKDMQEDKEPLFDAVRTILDCLQMLSQMIGKTRFRPEKMKEALKEGFILATDLADYLVNKGVPFREAHHIIGKLVAHSQKRKLDLGQFSLKEFKKFHPNFAKDVYLWLDHGHAVDRRLSLGGTARKNVKKEVERASKLIKKTDSPKTLPDR